MKIEVNPVRVLVKALCLFVLINFLYVLIDPQVSQASAYTSIFPGRTRLPFGISGDPYAVTVEDVDAMFASHLISSPKGSNEFRILLIGDSSIWGEGLGAYEVISEQWNQLGLGCSDKTIEAYNLGYPHPSVIKDLVLLDKAVAYEPDLVIWFVTLNTLISQRVNPFLVANRERTLNVLTSYDIHFKQSKKLMEDGPGFYERTLVGQRSDLARQIKLQALGILWTATRSDTNTLAQNAPPNFDVGDNPRYRGMEPSEDISDLLLFSALTAGHNLADTVPVLVVNEPIYIAKETLATVRYNVVYPRWVYDQYREVFQSQAQSAGWNYLDLWNTVPREYFLDGGLHLSAAGERLLIEKLTPVLPSLGCQ
jgi:hypothetical protein